MPMMFIIFVISFKTQQFVHTHTHTHTPSHRTSAVTRCTSSTTTSLSASPDSPPTQTPSSTTHASPHSGMRTPTKSRYAHPPPPTPPLPHPTLPPILSPHTHAQMPVENLVHQLSDIKQGYTQMGGLRPFGVSFLYAGWDAAFGYQLYHSDPSGNYSAWKANAIGQGTDTAQGVLKSDWKEGLTMKEGMLLGCKILSRTKDGSLDVDKMEFGQLVKVWATCSLLLESKKTIF